LVERARQRIHGRLRKPIGEGTNLAAAGFLSDVHNPTAPIALQKIYRGAATDADARRLAHQFADDIVAKLSGGLPASRKRKLLS
jgi:TolB protein